MSQRMSLRSLGHWRCVLLALAFCLMHSSPAAASSVALLLGPASAGNGGSNPVGIPPSLGDIAIKYLSSGYYETTVSLVPGLLFGKRFQDRHLYVSTGGGLLMSISGAGLGVYTSFGLVSGTGSGVHFNAEYTQSLGINGKGWTAPGAGRIGAIWGF
jgi:hypothetical protein